MPSTQNAKIKTWEIVVETGAELTVSGDVVIGYYDEGNQQKHQKGGLNMKAGSKMTIADGAKVALDGALLNSGTLVVNEDFAIRQTMGSGATTLTRGEASIEVNGTKFSYTGFNKDGATDNIALIAAQYNPWASSEKITDEETESTVILNNGTEFVVDNATLHIGKNGALCVNASSVDADIVTNNGTINVTGESELTIGALTGKISLQEGAALKDSSITGDKTASIYSYGDVTVKNSTLRITDENYGQNALRVSEGTATLSGTNSISGLATDHEDGNNGELKIIVADGTTMVGSEGGYKKAESGNGFDIAGDAVIGNIIVRNGGDLEVVNEATLNLIGQLSNRGTVTVRGNMLITGIQGAGNVGLAGSGDVDESGSMIIDGGKLTDKQSEYVSANDLHAVINMTIGHSASTGVSEADPVNTVTLQNNAEFKTTNTWLTIYADGALEVTDGSTFSMTEPTNNTGSGVTWEESKKDQVLLNNGTINVSDSTFSVDSVSNIGTFLISGVSTVCASVTGNISFAATGTTLGSDTSLRVTGDIDAAGDLCFEQGDVTASQTLKVTGTLSIDGISVPVGSSVTSVYEGSLTYNSLVLSGSNVVNNTIIVDGMKYDVDFDSNNDGTNDGIYLSVNQETPNVEDIEFSITGITQTSGTYDFNITLSEIKNAQSDVSYTVEVFDTITGSLVTTSETLSFTLENENIENIKVSVTVMDAYGESTSCMENAFVPVRDFTAPTITIEEGFNNTTPTNQNQTIKATVCDNFSDSVTLFYQMTTDEGTGEWQVYDTETGVEMTSRGTLTFNAIDSWNNSVTETIDFFNIDKEPPTLTITGNASAWTNEAVTLQVVAQDNVGISGGILYQIDGGEWQTYSDSGVVMQTNGKVIFKTADQAGNEVTEEVIVDKIIESSIVRGDLDANGLSDIVMVHDAGFVHGWLSQESGEKEILLNDLSATADFVGTGKVYGSVDDGRDIFTIDNGVVSAWDMADGEVAKESVVASFDPATREVLGLGDFNGDGVSDILLRSSYGDVGSYLSNGKEGEWNYFQSLGNEWEVAAIGDFNGDNIDDVALYNTMGGYAGTWLISAEGTPEWADLDTLEGSILGAGDFNADGIDDVLIRKGSWLGAWIVEDGKAVDWIGISNDADKFTVEQIGDFDGNGIDDIRIRTTNGDLSALCIAGDNSVSEKYLISVGSEWKTATSGIIC